MDRNRYSGLTDPQAARARADLVLGCDMLLDHAPEVNYTEGPQRWSAISEGLRFAEGKYLTEGDCSSTVTWLLWNVLHTSFGLDDIVNGEDWKAGYTGTLAQHGKPVMWDTNVEIGDVILYGTAWPYVHCTMALSNSECFSHGSQAGPFRESIDYRPDRKMIRRFI